MRIRQNIVSNKVTKKLILTTLTAGLVSPLLLGAATFGLNDIPNDFKFNRTLKQGDTIAPDVSYLQFILNQSASTKVAETGAGSLTDLTNFFGAKTHSAVTRFQEKYRDEILVPANITNPTGVVGENTRKKLNKILASLFSGTYTESNSSILRIYRSSVSSSNTVISNNQSTTKRPPTISSFSTFKAFSGQLMSLFGSQFHTTKNTVYLGSQKIGDYPSLDNGTKITFKVPSTLETGLYEAAVVNSYGTTSTGSMFLNVTRQTISASSIDQNFAPRLTTIYPSSSKNLNDFIFLNGENFSLNNTLETNLGTTVVRSTDSKNISFMISELPYYMDAFRGYKGQSINVLIKVRNENGLSKELVHVIHFPNTDSPTINLTTQAAPASFGLGGINNDTAEMTYQRSLDTLNTNLSRFSTTGTTSRATSSTSQTSTGTASGNGSSGSNSSFGGSSSGGNSGSGSSGSGSTSGSGGITYFGGQITQVTYCTCSGAILLAIRDLASKQTLQVFYRYGQSTLHANYNVFTTGINVIGGLTQGGGACEVYSGNSCSTQGNAQYTIDTVRGVGTGMSAGS